MKPRSSSQCASARLRRPKQVRWRPHRCRHAHLCPKQARSRRPRRSAARSTTPPPPPPSVTNTPYPATHQPAPLPTTGSLSLVLHPSNLSRSCTSRAPLVVLACLRSLELPRPSTNGAALLLLALKPLVDALEVVRVTALAPHDAAVVTRKLSVRRAPVVREPADAADVLSRVPRPVGNRAPALYGDAKAPHTTNTMSEGRIR
mmetsp:Transcript_29702/g.96756  ORF Transcript_29702/g.96756 Transcript_29702/m.96756 type:complete len:203 (-) Transcript_29702:23-631(-)